MSDPLSEIVEIGARAACKARRIDPDYCTLGAGTIRSDGFAASECYRRAWQDAAMELYPALLGILAAGFAIVPIEPSAEIVAAIWRAFGAPDQDRTEALMKTWLQGHKAMIAALTPAERRE